MQGPVIVKNPYETPLNTRISIIPFQIILRVFVSPSPREHFYKTSAVGTMLDIVKAVGPVPLRWGRGHALRHFGRS